MPPPYFCGYEGGGTNTTCIVMDSSCRVLGRSAGSGSNHYLVGLPAVAALLADLARAALQHAGISLPPAGAPPVFAALGMCGSGFLEPAPQRALEALLRAEHPWLSSAYYIDNDSPGSIYTAAGAAGGCVIVAGTGSMGQLMGADGSVVNCGGNGHMYGDEGSAYAIASAAIRGIFHALDGFDPNEPSFYSASAPLGDPRHPPQNTSAACSAMLRYFSLSEPAGMLDVMYGAGFKKDAVAGFAVEVSALGQAGDRFCAGVMARAGRELGAHLRAMVKRRAAGSAGGSAGAGAGGGAPAGGSAGAGAGGGAPAPPLSIVCVGSVWKSWELLKESFVRAACAGGAVTAFRLVRLTESSAVGAAWQAGVRAGHAGLALDTTAFVEVLYEHGPPPPRPAEVPQAHPEHGLTVFADGSRKLEDR